MRRKFLLSEEKSRPRLRRSCGFQNLLWQFKIKELKQTLNIIKEDPKANQFHKSGFANLDRGLNEFLGENSETYDKEFAYLKIFSSASIASTDIIRTTGNYYEGEWFSDVVVNAEGEGETEWYGKVCTS